MKEEGESENGGWEAEIAWSWLNEMAVGSRTRYCHCNLQIRESCAIAWIAENFDVEYFTFIESHSFLVFIMS